MGLAYALWDILKYIVFITISNVIQNKVGLGVTLILILIVAVAYIIIKEKFL